MASFAIRRPGSLLQPGDLLRLLYNGIDDGLLRTDGQAQAPNPPEDHDEDEDHSEDDDEDDEQALNMEDQRAFLGFEVRLPHRSGGIHDFEARDPAVSSAGRNQVANQLSFLENQLTRAQVSLPPSEVEFEAACIYAENVAKNGQPDETLQKALQPSTLSDLRDWVGRFTRFNMFFERHHEQENAAASRCNLGDSSADPENSQSDMAHHESLYALLNDRLSCRALGHHALLELPGSDQASFNMFLSACREAEAQELDVDWHEGSHETCFMFGSCSPDNTSHTHLDICNEICRYRRLRRRLYMSFNKSRIWPSSEPQGSRPRLLETPKPVSLSARLQQDSLSQENLGDGFKKYHLALQLALSLQRLYPGPWIQHNWNAHTIHLLGGRSGDASQDLGRICIPCKLDRNWKETNAVWREFNNAHHDRTQDCPAFFLSFAQLLVDISEGKVESYLPGTDEEWCEALIDKADEMVKNKLLEWYGQAIRGCVWYAVDYGIKLQQIKDPRRTAQAVIQNIAENLRTNLNLWKVGGFDDGSEVMETPGTASEQTSIPRKAAASELARPPSSSQTSQRATARSSFFTLFADGDEIYEERKPDGYSDDFTCLMNNFKLDYILSQRLDRESSSVERPIRIAVLDTGFHFDDSDNLLYSGRKRILKDLSGNFLGITDDERRDYDDTHGHGTHVVRLLLQLTVRAQIVVVKVSNGRSLELTKMQQLVDALKWAGEEADVDIINLSFGLDDAAKQIIQPVIQDLVHKGKLIFAAASNSGGNGRRAYPAKENGVFAIHATKVDGSIPENLNPPSVPTRDNFATLGFGISSYWRGKEVFISGTSFAAPVAASIAANALEFIQRAPRGFHTNPRYFFSYGGMRHLLTYLASPQGNYHYIRPWNDEMFIGENTAEDMQDKLKKMSIMGYG